MQYVIEIHNTNKYENEKSGQWGSSKTVSGQWTRREKLDADKGAQKPWREKYAPHA